MTMPVRVGDIRCSQSTISAYFKNGSPVEDLISEIRNGQVNPNSLGICVHCSQSGNFWALDHRRLWAVRQAKGLNYRLQVLVCHDPTEFVNKQSAKNGGQWPTSLALTGGNAQDHTMNTLLTILERLNTLKNAQMKIKEMKLKELQEKKEISVNNQNNNKSKINKS